MNFKDIFLVSSRQAKEYMSKMQNGEYDSLEDFTYLLKGYILKKFLLDDSTTTDKIPELLDQSIKKILELTNGDGLDMSDNPTCTGSSSKVEKKLLMLVKIKKDLGLNVGIDQLVIYSTVTELSKRIYELLNSTE